MPTHFLKKASIIMLMLNLFACSTLSPAVSTPSTADIEKEEQAIYAFFLPNTDGTVLILESTSSNISSDNPRQSIDYIQTGLQGVSTDTVKSFLERNIQPSLLSVDMELGIEYKLLNIDELKAITSQPNWGEILTQKHPGSYGYTIFSRVGFNNKLDQALVYVGNVAGPLMGSGFYNLMEKQDGQWILKEQVMAWIS